MFCILAAIAYFLTGNLKLVQWKCGCFSPNSGLAFSITFTEVTHTKNPISQLGGLLKVTCWVGHLHLLQSPRTYSRSSLVLFKSLCAAPPARIRQGKIALLAGDLLVNSSLYGKQKYPLPPAPPRVQFLKSSSLVYLSCCHSALF